MVVSLHGELHSVNKEVLYIIQVGVSLHGELHSVNKEILYIIQWWFHCMANYTVVTKRSSILSSGGFTAWRIKLC